MTRLTPEQRMQSILKAAVKLSRESSYLSISRLDVAIEAEVSETLINHYFGNMQRLRDAVMTYAVEAIELQLIAQGLSAGNKIALMAPKNIRAAAAETMKV